MYQHYSKCCITPFHSHLIYTCQMWSQNCNSLMKIQPLQDKALQVINFKAKNQIILQLAPPEF